MQLKIISGWKNQSGIKDIDHLCFQHFIVFALNINFRLDCEFWPMGNICRGMVPRNTAMKTTSLLSFTGIFSIQVWILRFCLSVEDTWSTFLPVYLESSQEKYRWAGVQNTLNTLPASSALRLYQQTGPDRKQLKNFPSNVLF